GHLRAEAAHEIFGELREQLARRRLIGPVRAVEEADLHECWVLGAGCWVLVPGAGCGVLVPGARCCVLVPRAACWVRYQSIVRRRPSRKSVVAENPNASRA